MTEERKEELLFIGRIIADDEEKQGKKTGLRQYLEYCESLPCEEFNGLWSYGPSSVLYYWRLYDPSSYSSRRVEKCLIEEINKKLKEREKE